jgi:hypothetical protein
MLSVFVFLAALILIVQALIGLGFLVSSIREREIVFARNRYLEPGSERYREFYCEHPEWEEIDARRREKGGPLAAFGVIDRPHQGPNRAAVMASGLFTMQLATPDRVKLQPRGPSLDLSPEEVNGSLRWKLDETTCFDYWGKVGTDCNVCMRVCP